MQSYIPIDIILKIVDNLDTSDLEAYFSSSKELVKLSNNPRVLKYISDRFQLPYVSSFSDMVYLINMDIYKLGELAVKAKDIEYLKVLFPIDSITQDTIALSVSYPSLLEYFLSLHKYNHNELFIIVGKRAINKGSIESIDIIINHIDKHEVNNLLIELNNYAILSNKFKVLKHIHDKYGKILSTFMRVDMRKVLKFGKLAVVKYMLDKYKSIFKPFIVIDYGIENYNTEVVDYLVDRFGKDITDKQAYSLYINALKKGETKIAIYIIDKFGDRINLNKALKVAKIYDNKKVIKKLKSL